MLPTLAEVLELEPVRRGLPRTVAGSGRLDSPIRWVHVAEIADIAPLLRGGELVLTTGIAFPEEASGLRRYVAALAEVGVSGLMVELGRRYTDELPPALVRAAEQAGLPVVVLRREIPFVDVTEAVHARILDAQLAELRASERLHEIFTRLSVEGAAPGEVVRQVAALSGRPAVLENLSHQVLAADAAGSEPAALLDSWESRSRAVRPDGRTGYDEASGWLVTVVGARDEDWGRLILALDAPPSPRETVLVERAATTLALGRLLDRHEASLELQAHGTLISGILAGSYSDAREAAARARALGVRLAGRRLLGVVVRARAGEEPERLTGLAEAVAAAAREVGLSALVGVLDEGSPQARVGMLAALPPRVDVDPVLAETARRLRVSAGVPEPVMAAGSVVDSLRDVRGSFREAEQVADVVVRSGGDRLFHRLSDLRLRGLLHLLRDDARLQMFVERELSPLLEHDAQRGGDLTGVLSAYLDCGRNKAMAAQHAHLSRPALYERLHRVERVLNVDLDDVETCTSLHVALLALASVRRGHP
ncbi:PucR family transcriptional regulator [Actinocorallia sp. B10E7]|uniref:PucR family transcriptional regulator n=1 Tax=Actinocorallia sp. B10E7 TaxID=3153558 RepID=UPI00325E95E6